MTEDDLVGLEDNLFLGKGQLAPSNADQVAKIRRILEEPAMLEFLERNYQRSDFIASAAFTDWARKQLPVEKQIVERFNLAESSAPSK